MNYRIAAVALVALLATGCDWLILNDTTPPTCVITSPADSALVTGDEVIMASAEDAFSVARVEFYVDDALLAADSSAPFSAPWPTSGLAVNSWHRLQCKAYDPSDNMGPSGVVNVQVLGGGQRSVFHGEIVLPASYYAPFGFAAQAGDSLTGDVLVATGGTLGTFMVLDRAGYAAFRTSGSYTPLLRQDNFSSFAVTLALPAADSFYAVIWNSGTGSRTVWTRLALE
jgi:hypothetical protein